MTKPRTPKLSELIAEERAKRRQTLDEAAKVARTTRSTFDRWEGGAVPQPKHMPGIAAYLHVNLHDALRLREEAAEYRP